MIEGRLKTVASRGAEQACRSHVVGVLRICSPLLVVLVRVQVGQQLNSLISDHLMQGSSNFFSSSSSGAARGAPSTASFHRPLLILIDRNEDLITSLHHTSTYQVSALILGLFPSRFGGACTA